MITSPLFLGTYCFGRSCHKRMALAILAYMGFSVGLSRILLRLIKRVSKQLWLVCLISSIKGLCWRCTTKLCTRSLVYILYGLFWVLLLLLAYDCRVFSLSTNSTLRANSNPTSSPPVVSLSCHWTTKPSWPASCRTPSISSCSSTIASIGNRSVCFKWSREVAWCISKRIWCVPCVK